MLRRSSTILAVLSAVLASCLASVVAHGQRGSVRPSRLRTRWTASVTAQNALPEYPRPQLVRPGWQNLNGAWRYAITPKDASPPTRYQGTILVPYPLESLLSGVQKPLAPDQSLWYRRTFSPAHTADRRTLLHFGAVDYETTVYVNGKEVGGHTGGYQRFTIDITPAIRPGVNELVVKVNDPTDDGPDPHGKQTLHPEGILYTPSSGIWQTVWIESVPETSIETLTMTPDLDRSDLDVRVGLRGPSDGYTVEAIARTGPTIVARQVINGPTALHIDHPHRWSPDDPFLYDLELRALRNGKVVDDVRSYFGMRKIEVRKDSTGTDRIFLNGRYTYNLGVLDQGFWPDGLYTAPTDAALAFDIRAIKAMGFNTIRKHIKIEPDRWYYYCDRLGLLVWQDMVPPANATPDARGEFEREVAANLAQLHNHPSITTWVLFNEGWGAYDEERLARWVKQVDPSRLLDPQSGTFQDEPMREWVRHLAGAKLWQYVYGDPSADQQALEDRSASNWTGGDIADFHHYPDPVAPPVVPGLAGVAGEHGGVGVFVDGHTWTDLTGWGYIQVTPAQLIETYGRLRDQLVVLQGQGVSGSIYTQPYDVETEQNGLMTYDRAIIKMPVARVAQMNRALVPTAKNYAVATAGFSAQDVDVTPQVRRYAELVAEYTKGRRDLPFLRHLTLLAVRQKDQVRATDFGNAYIDRSPRPYTRDMWAFIQAVTRTSRDRGFELFRAHANTADSVLGPNVAEVKVRDVIGREEIDPVLADTTRAPDWSALETAVSKKYGPLGAEKVDGAAMFRSLVHEDWASFGTYYARYYRTAAERSEYPINPVSYAVLRHLSDPEVLAVAISAEHANIGRTSTVAADPTELDTYAGLLYKAGQRSAAVEWEEKAAQVANGLDREITDDLAAMKAGRPTW